MMILLYLIIKECLQIVTTANYNLTIIPAPSSSVNVATGGKIQIGDGIVIVGTGYEGFASSLSNVWNDASTFEWTHQLPLNLVPILYTFRMPVLLYQIF